MLNIYNQKNGNGTSESDAGSKIPKPNYTRYVDPTAEMTTSEFKWGFWYARNRVILYRVAIGVLIGLSVIFWLYTFIKGGSLAMYSLEKGSQLDSGLSYFYNYSVIHPAYSPSPLLISATQILSGGVKKYDLLGEVSNPNDRFYVSFDYYFTAGDGTTETQNTFLLPGETRMITYLGYDKTDYPSGAELIITNLKWRRISNHEIIDTAKWQAEHLNFVISNFSFIRTGDTTESAAANTIKFDLKNDSPYSFVETKFEVGLYQGEALVGVLPLQLLNFKSNETRAIDLRSFVTGLNVTDIKVFPVIDIYNEPIYLPPES